jgi:hypothetical protein
MSWVTSNGPSLVVAFRSMNAKFAIVRRIMSRTGSCGIIGANSFNVVEDAVYGRRQGLVEEGFEEVVAGGVGGGEAGLQAVEQGHQGVDLGDDAVLFGERWEGDRHSPEIGHIHPLKRNTLCFAIHPKLAKRRINRQSMKCCPRRCRSGKSLHAG